jgi:hypothetical protein
MEEKARVFNEISSMLILVQVHVEKNGIQQLSDNDVSDDIPIMCSMRSLAW